MKIALLGAGAVGGYYIWGFENAGLTDREFTVIADGDRRERLIRDGISVNGKVYHPSVKSPDEAGTQDLVLVCVKGNTLKQAVDLIPPLVGDDTVVLSMLNGGDSEEIIAAKIGKEHVLHSIIMIASRRSEGKIVFDTTYNTTVYYGAAGVPEPEKKMKIVADAFAGTDMNVIPSRDIMLDIWTKYAKNICNNLPQAIIGVPAALYTRSEHGLFIAQKLWSEVRTLAKLRGIDLPEKAGIYECADSSRYSTLQDIDAKRPTEVDSLCGYLIDMARENNISVPYIEYTYHAIKAVEEKNEGLFEC